MHRFAAAVAIAESCAFVSSNTLVKALAGALPAAEIGLFRAVGGLLLLAVVWPRLRSLTKIPDPLWHLLRGLSGAGTILCFMYAMTVLPFALAVTVYYARVLLMIPLAKLLLEERPAPGAWGAAVIGIVGVAVALTPSLAFSGNGLGAAAIIGAALLSSFSQIAVTRLTRSNVPGSIVGVFACVAVGVLLPTAWFHWIPPSLEDWPVLAAIALTGVLAQWLAAHAYRLAGASFAAPFSYLEIPMAAAIGYLFWDEGVDYLQLVGGLIVIGSTAYIMLAASSSNQVPAQGRDVSAGLSTRASQQNVMTAPSDAAGLALVPKCPLG